MHIQSVIQYWENDLRIQNILQEIELSSGGNLRVKGLPGSSPAFVLRQISAKLVKTFVVILPDKESALHMFNDLETLFDDTESELSNKQILFFPPSYNNPYDFIHADQHNVLFRSTVLQRLSSGKAPRIIVCSPESFLEPVKLKKEISSSTFSLTVNEKITMEFLTEFLDSYDFTITDYVFEPGQYAIRGGLIDVYSYSYDRPFRIEFSGNDISSIRSFNPYTQESVKHHQKVMILANVGKGDSEKTGSLFSLLDSGTIFWMPPVEECMNIAETEHDKFLQHEYSQEMDIAELLKGFLTHDELKDQMTSFMHVEVSSQFGDERSNVIDFGMKDHPQFARNFEMLFQTLKKYKDQSISTLIFCENAVQMKRLDAIIEDFEVRENIRIIDNIQFVRHTLHGGFVDPAGKYALLTDHQIFERYHRFRLTERYSGAEGMTIRDLRNIQPGDYVIHVDYGVGQYAGLEKIDVSGREQEAIRIVYKNNDLLYVSIHSLHKISKFTGKEGTEPQLDRIGSGMWQQKKYKAKSKVKDIARELIKLYSERKNTAGFAFQPDSYLQFELEASFMFEDTEDQAKATQDVKLDMEATFPMDRLVCGDVGFGKTEVAIRAAFKAAVSGKQTAVLVPTTILALQHYHTFSQRLTDFPVKVEYLNRFRSSAEVRKVLDQLRSGAIDIIIGTHKLLGKDVEFKDLGLLVVDEEQKFGVSAKEKIRQLKVNVDTITMTATPIPRTLQFSLMGARDLSVINTPPPNRQPVHTEIINFNARRIAEIIMYEVNRGGQVFFINNKILNIQEVARMIRNLCPGIRVETGHGQMEGKALEKTVMDFIEGKFDVFVCTAIIESGIDIPNANTMIINDAQNFGLSDLHQLRGRVGRSNKKAFCYLITPPPVTLSEQSRKRLRALVEFSDLGSGLQIALRDLDIRGAGNMLGAEQSGFISEIGYEMYKKILDEAMDEVRYEESTEEPDYTDPSKFVRECLIETDMSLLIPDNYVSNFNERLALYKDLDSLQSEKQLQAFENRLRDRFGPVPDQTSELINTVRLRWLARSFGIVKVTLKNQKMTIYFFETEDERFFQSEVYTTILQYVFDNPKTCIMKQNEKGQLYIAFAGINTVRVATERLQQVVHFGAEQSQVF
jgi:transcription-repair coupling factor (superfamily II helicase)